VDEVRFSITPYTDVEEAIHAVDQSDFGLRADIFTCGLRLARKAFVKIEVGA
jgi:acyl-CoA reductase-like NAD-dependent aldehyde dehydrogenase